MEKVHERPVVVGDTVDELCDRFMIFCEFSDLFIC